MNLTIERGVAASALGRLIGVVEKKGSIEILANVVVRASNDRVSLRTMGSDMEAVEEFAATVKTAGETTVPADKLHEIVRAADTGAQVSLTLGDGDPRAQVRSGRSNFRLPTLPVASFPSFDAEDLGPEFVISAKTLSDMFSRVVWGVTEGGAALRDMSNVFFGVRSGELHAAACSTDRIVLRREPVPEGASFEAILPPRFVTQAIAWMGDADAEVFVSCSDRLIRLRSAQGVLTSRLFDWPGPFVDYMGFLLQNHELFAATDQDALKMALHRATIMSDARTHAVKLAFADGAVTLQARNAQTGEGADEIPVEYDGPPVTLMLSQQRLARALAMLRGDRVEIGFAPKVIERNVPSIQVVIRAPADPGFIVNLTQPRA